MPLKYNVLLRSNLDEIGSGGGGYTDLTQFIDQTPWRVFYSDGNGDVIELALGASGTFLKSNGASSAPTFATPAGSGDVVGPASSVNNNVVFFDGVTGKLIKDSGLTLSGSNTGDQTSIVGITGTKAQFDTAVTDGNFLYVGDITQYTDEMAQDAVGAMVDATLVYVDGTPLLTRAALTGDVTAAQASNVTTIANDAVTYSKMQNVSAASKLLGRGDSGSGDVQEITLGSGLTMTGTTLSASGGSGDITAVGDVASGAAFDGTAGSILTAGPNLSFTLVTQDSVSQVPGGIDLTPGTATGGGFDGGSLTGVSGDGNGAGFGGLISFYAGAGGATGAGGAVEFYAGNGGATSGNGGIVNFAGGNSLSGSGSGGSLVFTPGSTSGGGTHGAIDLNGSVKIKRTSVSDANYTALTSDYLISYSSLSTGRTITLYASSGMTGRVLVVKDETGSAATNNITIDGNASETIDGATTYVLNRNYGSITIYCNGSNWFII